MFLEMNEGARSLDEPFEKLVVIRIGVQPKLLENIVRFVIPLLVPALKKGAIKWVLRDVRLFWIDLFSRQLCYESRNPLAFSHEGFNLVAAQIMSKPARINFPEGTRHECPVCEFSQPGWLCRHR
jgi:hypothetical protein